MKHFLRNEEKNELLKEERQISFEDVVFYISQGFLLDVLEYPNQETHQGQSLRFTRSFVIRAGIFCFTHPHDGDGYQACVHARAR